MPHRTTSMLFLAAALATSACSDDDDMTNDPNPCPRVTSVEQAVEVYGSAWNEPDEAKRLCILERSVSPDLVYVDPTVDTATAADLSKAIAGFRAQVPTASLVPVSQLETRTGELRFVWDFRAKDAGSGVEQSVIKGVDYIEFGSDNRLTQIRGYWDPIPTAAPEGTLADYAAAVTALDAATRDAKLSAALADDVRYTNGTADVRGRQAVSAALSRTDVQSVAVSGTQRYPKFARMTFDVAGSAETKEVHYLYLDGASRITRIAHFYTLEPGP